MDSWILRHLSDTFSNSSGELYIEGVSAKKISEEFGTPIYVTSEKRIRNNFRRLYKEFSNGTNFRLYYAVKANSNLAILSILRSEGAWADCSCPAEIYEASLAGFPEDKMLYTGNYNSREELEFALKSGVTINFDDGSIIDKIPTGAVPEAVCFRINPGIGKGGKEGLVFAGPDSKFGSPEDVARYGYKRAKEMGVKRFGIHMMTGSNVLDPRYFPQITEILMNIAGRIARELQIEFEFVNIGGGFGIPYRPDELPLPIDEVAKSVVDVFKAKSEEYKMNNPELAVEPGRYLVGDSSVLLARVCHIKTRDKIFVGLDAGMNTLLRPALYGAYHPILVANNLDSKEEVAVNICGQVCENTDMIAKDRLLPSVKEGDLLAIFNAGAYGFSMASQYNNRPRPSEVLISGNQAELIRRRETMSDLISTQLIPPRLLHK